MFRGKNGEQIVSCTCPVNTTDRLLSSEKNPIINLDLKFDKYCFSNQVFASPPGLVDRGLRLRIPDVSSASTVASEVPEVGRIASETSLLRCRPVLTRPEERR